MKSLKDKKFQIGLASIVLVLAIIGGVYLFNHKATPNTSGGPKPSENTNQQQIENNLNTKEKSLNNQNQNTTNNTTNNTSGQSQQAQKDDLTDVSLQATLNPEDQSIAVSLYGNNGVYTIDVCKDSLQACASGTWQNVATKASYSGAGGLSLNGSMPVSETAWTYRIYRINNNQSFGPKEILIDRNLVRQKGVLTAQ